MQIQRYPNTHPTYQQAKKYGLQQLSTVDGEGIIDCEAFELSKEVYLAVDEKKQIAGFLLIAQDGLLEKLAKDNLFEPQPLEGLLIQQLFVDPAFRQKGIASQLLEAAQQQQKDLYLYVSDKNQPAKKFYAKKGFHVIGVYETPKHHTFTNFKAYLLKKKIKKR
ncbi:GNAT family N-acetyltransferase [Enterococcus sp. AZ109]|uniref:GNAT family N-acetyltransferase n=1 Tax=Enterococcus sp. AZ109 TaxID=2774634 RepID=UPI003F21236C